MVSRGTKKPYAQAIGASATGVTQSCYIVRFKKYVIMLDCGLYQESDITTNYKKNQELLKKEGLKPENIIDSNICTMCHPEYFHSYRVDKENSGRNAAIISLTN